MWTQDRICSGSSVMDLERGYPIDFYTKDLFLNLYAQTIDDGYMGFAISASGDIAKEYRVHFIPEGLVGKSVLRHINRNRFIHYFYDVSIHFDRQTGIWGDDLEEKKPEKVFIEPAIQTSVELFSDSICAKFHKGLHEKRRGNALIILRRSEVPGYCQLTEMEMKEVLAASSM